MIQHTLRRFWDWLYWGNGASLYASFERRIIASMVDTLVLSFFFATIFAPFFTEGNEARQAVQHYAMAYKLGHLDRDALAAQLTQFFQEGGGVILLRDYMIQIVLIGILMVFSWQMKGTTPGKWLLNMEIVDAKTGERPMLWQWLLRYLGYFVASLPLMLGFVSIMWNRRRQGWHDKMARTVVVLKPKPGTKQ